MLEPLRVMVCSTCYDLIDLRCELDEHLRALGFLPLRSDDPGSGWEIVHTVNSIEMCRVNVQKADHVVFVLSQRYGDPLVHYGYDHLSGTHLEYRWARELRKPIHFFIRDHLMAEFQVWRSADRTVELVHRMRRAFAGKPPMEYLVAKKGLMEQAAPSAGKWVRGVEALRLYAFILERELDKTSHRAADGTVVGGSDWMDTFRTVVELKRILSVRLGRDLESVTFEEMRQRGQLPFVQLAFPATPPPDARSRDIYLELTNIGPAPAIFDAKSGCAMRPGDEEHEVEGQTASWAPSQPAVLQSQDTRTIRLTQGWGADEPAWPMELRIVYSTIQDIHVADVYSISCPREGTRSIRYEGKLHCKFLDEKEREREGDA